MIDHYKRSFLIGKCFNRLWKVKETMKQAVFKQPFPLRSRLPLYIWIQDFVFSATCTHFNANNNNANNKTWTLPGGSTTKRVQQRRAFNVGDGTSVNYLCKSGIFLFASGSVKVLLEKDVWCSFDSSAAENKAIVSRLQQSRGQVVVKEANEEDKLCSREKMLQLQGK